MRLAPLGGRTVVVTGAGRGVGYFAAEQFAVAGARVIITTRDAGQADAALERLIRPVAHGKDRSALLVLRAATDPDAQGGEFYGPSRSTTGAPALATPVAQSADPAFGAAFWRIAEEATGIRFDV